MRKAAAHRGLEVATWSYKPSGDPNGVNIDLRDPRKIEGHPQARLPAVAQKIAR